MFYCDNIIAAYPTVPDDKSLNSIIEQGYNVYLYNENGEVEPLKKTGHLTNPVKVE